MPWFPPYVPVGARRARVARVSDELRRNGVDVQPVHIEGRTIARSFWGPALVPPSGIVLRLREPPAAGPRVCAQRLRLPPGHPRRRCRRHGRRIGPLSHCRAHSKARKCRLEGDPGGVRGPDRIRPRAAPGPAVRSRPARRHRSRPRPVPEARRDHPHVRLSRLGGHVQARGRGALRRRQPARRPSRAALPPAGRRRRGSGRRRHGAAGRGGGGRRSRRRGSRGHLRHRSRPGGQRRGGRRAEDLPAPAAPPQKPPADRRPALRVRAYGPRGGRSAPPGRILGRRVRRPAPRGRRRRCIAGKRSPGRSSCAPVRRTPCRCCTGRSTYGRQSRGHPEARRTGSGRQRARGSSGCRREGREV